METNELRGTEAYRLGSSEAMQKILIEVERESKTRVQKGFNQTNFTVGVLNLILIVYIFGALPQHFWILYIVEAFILITNKFFELKSMKPLSGSFYILDYCWAMNFIGVFALIHLALAQDSEWFHELLFSAAVGVACGPLLGAAGILPFVTLIFHDFGVMCDVFIHIFPPMLMYTFMWNADEIKKSWPGVFDLDYNLTFFPTWENWTDSFAIGTVFWNTIILYFFWLIPYVCWMVFIGLDLPNSAGYDTVFHSTMRNGMCEAIGTIFWKRPVQDSKKQMATNKFEKKDLLVYLTAHMLGVLLSLLFLAYPCFKSKHFHGFLLVVLTVVIVWRGAMRYHYYVAKLYVNVVQKVITAETQEHGVIEVITGVHEGTPLLT